MSKLFNFLKILTQRFFSDLCMMRAASLTFTTLLSIVPLVIFTFYIFSFFPALQSAGQSVEIFLLHNFVASSANTISQQLQNFVSQTKTLSWTTIISLISIALLMIYNIVDTVNFGWHVLLHRVSVFSFIIFFFFLFHWIIPSCRVYFRYAVFAGLITTFLFEIAKWGFVLYFHYFSTYQLVYGALATIPIFFIWIYLSWLILILGALICNLLQTQNP